MATELEKAVHCIELNDDCERAMAWAKVAEVMALQERNKIDREKNEILRKMAGDFSMKVFR
jgi:hypothetical protein